MKLIIDSHVHVPLNELTDAQCEIIREHFTYVNPEWMSAQSSGYGAHTIDKFIHNWEFVFVHSDQYLRIPRGGMKWINDWLNENGIEHVFVDKRHLGKTTTITINPELVLRDYQEKGIGLVQKAQQLVLNYEPGAGKTITALGTIAKLKLTTIILVNSERLMEQWTLEIFKHLNYRSKIGIIQGPKAMVRPITIAMVQTLGKWKPKDLQKLSSKFGLLIHDEVHHAPADGIHTVLENFSTKYRLGLTASKTRKDGLEFLIYDYYDKIRQYERGIILDPTFCFRNTGVKLKLADYKNRWSVLEEKLANDRGRNEFLVKNVMDDVHDGHRVLLLVNRNVAALALSDMLNDNGVPTIPFLGVKKDLCFNELKTKTMSGEIKCIVSCKVFDEGLDIPILSSLHMGSYQAAEEPFRQRLGRIRRPCEGKLHPKVTYYVDNISQAINTAKTVREWLLNFGCTEERNW